MSGRSQLAGENKITRKAERCVDADKNDSTKSETVGSPERRVHTEEPEFWNVQR